MTEIRANKDMAIDALTIAGDALVVPGASLLVKGKIKPGLLHLGAGLAAKVAIGPLGLALVVANSVYQAKTGKSLAEKFIFEKDPGDTSLRDEVVEAVNSGASLETIVESIVEDVEDFYHEATVKVATSAETTAEAASGTTAETASETTAQAKP